MDYGRDTFPFPNMARGFTSSRNTKELAIDLQDLLSHILQSIGRSFTGVYDSYFDGFHRWLPIISYENLERGLARYEGTYAPTELSLFILSMLLVVLRPEDWPSTNTVSPTVLYPEPKATFTRLQSCLPTTTPIIQVGLIITAYEYVSGRINEAYISIGTCTRIASVIGVEGVRYLQETGLKHMPCFRNEEQNIRWVLIFLER